MGFVSVRVFSVFSILTIIILFSSARVCVHKPARHDQVRLGVYVEGASSAHGSKQKRSADLHPLRIFVEYEDDVNALNKEHRHLIKDSLVPEATRYLSKLLSIKRVLSPIRLNRACAHSVYYKKHNDPHEYCQIACSQQTMCGPVAVPASHLQKCYFCQDGGTGCTSSGQDGTGVRDTDFILYVTAKNTIDCAEVSDTIAHASHCQQEVELDRPIAGYINLCPLSLSVSQRSMLLTTVVHEIIHALGFSAALYAFYRDEQGNPLTTRDASGLPPLDERTNTFQWSERVVKPVVRNDWDVKGGRIAHTVNLLVTKRVVEEARSHFNCATLEGVELENQGGYGTEITHFEKRILENEAMTGTHTHDRIISRLSLAVMEDTGWYQPNYTMADPLPWGKNLGCDFVNKSCKHWIDTQKAKDKSILPFCNIVRQAFNLSCSVGRSAVALCNLHESSVPLPRAYQYFDSIPGVPKMKLNKYGGSSELSDFCPYYQQFNYEKSTKSSECSVENNLPASNENVAAEYYGTGAKCFHHASQWRQTQCTTHWTQNLWGAGCHKYQCSAEGLAISIADTNYPCYTTGQKISVNAATNLYLHTGEIICPPCTELCGAQCPMVDRLPPDTSSIQEEIGIPCPNGSSRWLQSGSNVIIFLLLLIFLTDFLVIL